ncbi:MAG: putative transcriptional regulator [Candidatus Saccharibacteria bacterium]|nr:putative transcriptional regulator [Candidatus Saccharibacteria bacterium]
MVEQLFGSKTRVKLLQLFYSNPNRSFYVREITRKIDEQINSVRRELANLLSVGIISSDTTNNRLYYEVDQKYEYYAPLAAIFGGAPFEGVTVEGATPVVAQAPTEVGTQSLKSLGNVDLALYTGQFTRDERSGIDFLIVGDVNPTKLSKYVAELEEQEGKEIRYTLMSPDEFKYREQVNDRFLGQVLGSKKQVLVDKHHVLAPKPVKEKSEKE